MPPNPSRRHSVQAVIVCYGPDIIRLREICDRVIEAGAGVILVDNSDPPALPAGGQFDDCAVLVNERNVGIAKAQNRGIEAARAQGAEVVIFFDQDSQIAPGFMATLLAPLQPGVPDVVAPVSRDAAGGFEYLPTRVNRFGLQQKVPADGQREPYPVDIVISSGTAATIEALDVAGGMDEGLFIDFVDLEWCLRCRQRNVPIRVVPAAVMTHSVGSRSVRVGFVTVLVHSPLRTYYQVRNCLSLFRKDNVPRLLALREVAVLLLHKALLIAAVPDRRAYMRACAAGLRDGLAGITGPKPHQRRGAGASSS